MSLAAVSHFKRIGSALLALALAGASQGASAAGAAAPANAARPAQATPPTQGGPSSPPGAAAGTVLPPAVAAGSSPAAPEQPQGLGIGAAGASARELAAAAGRMVLQAGTYHCELNRNVEIRQVSPDGRSMVISWLGKNHSLEAVDARSGALRFENTAAGLVWLVIVGKSMLLDSHKGQQLANECTL
jgi:hypothetical protein